MITPDLLVVFIILVWAFLYTMSYGIWTWKRKNKLGAVMLFLLSITIVVLPIYTIFIISLKD